MFINEPWIIDESWDRTVPSLEEAIVFFESETVEKDEELKPKRRGGRRKCKHE